MKFLVGCLIFILFEVEGGNQKCTNPKGSDGDYHTEGCIKKTCKSGVWRASLDPAVCCYEGEAYGQGATVASVRHGCSMASVVCGEGGDKATLTMQVENKCKGYSTSKQVSELKEMVENYLANTVCGPAPSPLETTTSDTRESDLTTDQPSLREHEGILVSGGWGAERSVEFFNPETGKTCTLPDLPGGNRNGHTMDTVTLDTGEVEVVICGGGTGLTQSSCICNREEQLSTRYWLPCSMQPRTLRDGHSSWWSSDGLVLMGGVMNLRSTSLDFELRRDTRYACSIPFDDSVILTGGRDTMSVVARYNLMGFVESLPYMIEGRRYHGCGSYKYWDGHDEFMVLLVAGGRSSFGGITASTEVLQIGTNTWVSVAPLPRAMIAISGVSLNNTVFMTGGGGGGRNDYYSRRTDIFAYNSKQISWEKVGDLKKKRNFHAATNIDLTDFPGLCDDEEWNDEWK